MTRSGTLLLLLLLLWVNLITSALLTDLSQIKVYPKHGSISGVFHASLSAGYAFNASSARELCEHLGVAIADKAQVIRASTQGFQTCRFGWIDEQIAVIPRIQANPACGQGRVGVIVWRVQLTGKFDVYCFNSTDFEVHAQAATTKEPHKTPTVTVAPNTSQSSTSGDVKLVKTTASDPDDFWPDLRATFSGRSHAHSPVLNYPEDREQALALSSTKSTIGAVPTALLISTIFTFLMAAIVAVWYFKTGRSPPGEWDDGEQQQECIETEEWDTKQPEAEEEKQQAESADDVSVSVDCENESDTESREAE
ncbi:lymphatic vessel endothelial hyaluronic acid receptor 1-like [Astyanax mexicanus]|uniref:Lymphatic vessel endothelial hyaluronic acid receptor 1-like n=1 Tax=Astyanax mexicanus TaxID=7994 RepID=A0A8T2LAX1_ASTMX|nr:lymphatic vessel endothelial hyaluronic acid receptor 1-like [Astyanax mexicanus]